MQVPSRYHPCGLLDGYADPFPVMDSEASLFAGDLPWILAKTAEDLRAHGTWGQQGIHVAVVCVEAPEEDPLAIEWRYAAPHILYVRTADVDDLPSGTVDPRHRFTLRDLAIG